MRPAEELLRQFDLRDPTVIADPYPTLAARYSRRMISASIGDTAMTWANLRHCWPS